MQKSSLLFNKVELNEYYNTIGIFLISALYKQYISDIPVIFLIYTLKKIIILFLQNGLKFQLNKWLSSICGSKEYHAKE